MVRHLRGDRARRPAGEGAPRQRRLLRRQRLPLPRHPHGPDDARVRARADERLDRARARAVLGQPADPPGVGVRRAAGPALRADRRSRLRLSPRGPRAPAARAEGRRSRPRRSRGPTHGSAAPARRSPARSTPPAAARRRIS